MTAYDGWTSSGFYITPYAQTPSRLLNGHAGLQGQARLSPGVLKGVVKEYVELQLILQGFAITKKSENKEPGGVASLNPPRTQTG